MPKPKTGKSISPPRSGRPSINKSPITGGGGINARNKSNLNNNNKNNASGNSVGTAKGSNSNTGGSGSTGSASAGVDDSLPKPDGYLITCDIPTKQYILHLNAKETATDKKFLVEDLDATHLLVKEKAKDEILRQVEEWENSNVYSAIEKVGEDFDMS